jgi:hypothetical protein
MRQSAIAVASGDHLHPVVCLDYGNNAYARYHIREILRLQLSAGVGSAGLLPRGTDFTGVGWSVPCISKP